MIELKMSSPVPGGIFYNAVDDSRLLGFAWVLWDTVGRHATLKFLHTEDTADDLPDAILARVERDAKTAGFAFSDERL